MRQNLTDLLGKNMNKKFNVTHEFQPFIAEEISFNIVRRLSTDVLKSKALLPLFKAAKNAFPAMEPRRENIHEFYLNKISKGVLILQFIKLLAAKHSARGLMQFLVPNSAVNGIVVEILNILAK